MEAIKKFVKERNEMLLKCSVDELRKFVNNNADCYGPEFVEAINLASDKFLEMVLHNMIKDCITLPEEFRQKSEDWLKHRKEDEGK